MSDWPKARYAVKRFAVLLSLTALIACTSPTRQPNSYQKTASLYPTVLSRLMMQYPMVVSSSPDGSKILLKTRYADSFEITVIDRRTGKVLFSDSSVDTQLSLTWSPNSRALAFVSARDGDRHFRLSIWRLGNSKPEALGDAQTGTAAPPLRWSPDSSLLLFFSGTQQLPGDLKVVDVGQRTIRTLMDGQSADDDFQWSPDGRTIGVTTSWRPGYLRLIDWASRQIKWIKVAEGKTIRELAWRPDGKRIAMSVRDADGEAEGRYRLIEMKYPSQQVERCHQDDPDHDYVAPRYLRNDLLIFQLRKQGIGETLTGSCESTRMTQLGGGDGVYAFASYLPKSKEVLLVHHPSEGPATLECVSLDERRLRVIYQLPHYDEVRGPNPSLVKLRSSDGLEIPAFVWMPRDKSVIAAALVLVHGGPRLEQTREWDPLISLATARGFAVVAPNYRGSIGYGLKFESTGPEQSRVDDVLAACEFASRLPGMSMSRVVLYGSSYGSLLAAIATHKLGSALGSAFFVSTLRSVGSLPSNDSRAIDVFAFQGANDLQCDAICASSNLRQVFNAAFKRNRGHFTEFTKEGHLFSHTSSWATVDSQVLSELDRLAAG